MYLTLYSRIRVPPQIRLFRGPQGQLKKFAAFCGIFYKCLWSKVPQFFCRLRWQNKTESLYTFFHFGVSVSTFCWAYGGQWSNFFFGDFFPGPKTGKKKFGRLRRPKK